MKAKLVFANIFSYGFYYVGDDGFGVYEAIFFGIQLITYLLLFGICIRDAIIKSPRLSSPAIFVFSIILLILVATFFGLAGGNSLMAVFSEITYYTPLFLIGLLYLTDTDEQVLNLAIVALILTGVMVSIYNIINYQQIILQAAVGWKVEKARVANGEMLLVFTILYLFTTDFFKNKSFIWSLTRYGVIGVALVAIIISQSRGYWLLCFGSLFAYVVFSGLKVQLKLFLIGSFITPFIIIFIYSYASELELVFSGLYQRITSFTQLSRDTSLLERYIEYEQIKNLLIRRPFTGYGFGEFYNRQYIYLGGSIPKLYIHNAYYSVMYKFGIVGLISFLGMHVSIIVNLFNQHFIQKGNAVGVVFFFMYLLIFGLNITSPQYYSSEAMLVFVFGLLFINNGSKQTK